MQQWNGIQHLTVCELLAEKVEKHPDRTFATMGGWTATYAEIDARATEVAGQIHALGVRPGDRVATLSPNRYELLELLMGLAKLGVVQVPLNPYLRGEFLSHQLRDSAPSIILTDSPGWASVQPVLHEVPSLRTAVLFDAAADSSAEITTHRYHELSTGPVPDVALTAASTMAIVYTSGTTGQSKGCVLSHGYYTRCGQIDAELLQLTDDDVFFTTLPLFHGGSQLKGVMPSMTAGIPIVIEESFSASGFFKRLTETGATVASGVGSMGPMLLATPLSAYDRAHSLRVYNLSPLAEDLQREFNERFATDVWTESYGQTECVPSLSNAPGGPRDRGSNGHPIRDLEVALLDDHGQPVPDGEVGEICLRPRHRYAMFDGYWGRPEDTLEAFRGLWYHTGDFGVLRVSGSIKFADRKKDALRVRGENVSSIELEVTISRHPAVAEVAVHALKSEVGEDDIRACIVLAEGQEIEWAEFFEFLKANVPYFAVPRYVEILAELPKNSAFRVQKHQLRDKGMTAETIDFRALGLTIAREDRR
ncbi:AMP-binding protein [Pseudonocardia xishanensis]|uniref:ATP-dependent acyl-CoA ligase n=1 Tax=Pseudonocardia xishanensis TaxID=630995 RepID=A0ABP8RQD4_9PSEU